MQRVSGTAVRGRGAQCQRARAAAPVGWPPPPLLPPQVCFSVLGKRINYSSKNILYSAILRQVMKHLVMMPSLLWLYGGC